MVQKTSMRATLVQMEEGASLNIPLAERAYNSIRSCAAMLGVAYPGRKYSVSLDRASQSCKVTRVS